MTRREWLKGIGALAAGGGAAGCAAPRAGTADLREEARKRIKLGVFTSVYGALPLEEAAARIREDGFSAVVCEFAFADARFDPFAPDWDAAKRIVAAFERRGIEIAGLFGYYNVVDPDPARRARGEERIHLLIRNWKRLGSPVIATETGTFNRESEWLEAPENATEDGYLVCRAAFEALARAAEKTGAIVAIEPYWKNIIDSAARAERLFREVGSPSLRLVMDPCNYFRREDLPRMRETLEDIFARVGSRIALAHAKDVRASEEGTDLPAAGLGVLDYPLYLRLLARTLAAEGREMSLVIEHLDLPDVPRARDFVRSRMEMI